VTLDCGRVVEPHEVLADALDSQCFAFVFMPDETYIESFLENAHRFKVDTDQK